MSDFFRFPRIPHLASLGKETPRDDKVLSPQEAEALLSGDVVIEEKLDGANLGFSVGADGSLRLQNRGQYLTSPYSGQFERATTWLKFRSESLVAELGRHLILFGEWCAARHSMDYDRLPDWFLVFDVYDREAGRFWATARRNALAIRVGLPVVPLIYTGRASLSDLRKQLSSQASQFRTGPVEGIVIRREPLDWLEQRAKLVGPEFTQAIGDHWRRRRIEWNRLKGAA